MEPATRASNADIYAAVQSVQTGLAALTIEQRHTRAAVDDVAAQVKALNGSVRQNAQAIATESEWRRGHTEADEKRCALVDKDISDLRKRTDTVGVVNGALAAVLSALAGFIAWARP